MSDLFLGLTQQEFIRRFKTDWVWFAENAPFTIKDKTTMRLVDYVANDAQRLLNKFEYQLASNNELVRILVPKSRQLGISTGGLIRLGHKCATSTDINSVFYGHDMSLVNASYTRMLTMLRNIKHPSMQVEIVRQVQSFILGFSTESNILFQTTGKEGVGRGDTFNHLHTTEMPSWDNPEELLDGAHESIPDIPGWVTSIIHESTCKGRGDHWHHLCLQAEANKGMYKLFFLPWFIEKFYGMNHPNLTNDISYRRLKEYGLQAYTPDCGIPLGALLKHELSHDELELFKHIQVYGRKTYQMSEQWLTDDAVVAKILWRRHKVLSMRSEEVFQQEYPYILDEAFRGKGTPIFNGSSIKYHKENDGRPVSMFILTHDVQNDTISQGHVQQKWLIEATTDPDEANLFLSEAYDPDGLYILGADPSNGVTDNAVGQLVRVYEDHNEQVGKFCDLISAKEFGWVAILISDLFGECFIVPDRTGAGITMINEMIMILKNRTQRIYNSERISDDGVTTTKELGFNTHTVSRGQLIELLRDFIESPDNKLWDKQTIKEAEEYRMIKGRPDHPPNGHDDHLMALGLALKGIYQAKEKIRRHKNTVKSFYKNTSRRNNGKQKIGRKLPKWVE